MFGRHVRSLCKETRAIPRTVRKNTRIYYISQAKFCKACHVDVESRPLIDRETFVVKSIFRFFDRTRAPVFLNGISYILNAQSVVVLEGRETRNSRRSHETARFLSFSSDVIRYFKNVYVKMYAIQSSVTALKRIGPTVVEIIYAGRI